MKQTAFLFLPALLGAWFAAPSARACTAFLFEQEGQVVMGKSYDWDTGDALVMVNPRGVAKRSLLLSSSKAHEWVSKYASVTFNQYGREFPVGGMNEAGLVVEALWLRAARIEPSDARPALNACGRCARRHPPRQSFRSGRSLHARRRIYVRAVPGLAERPERRSVGGRSGAGQRLRTPSSRCGTGRSGSTGTRWWCRGSRCG